MLTIDRQGPGRFRVTVDEPEGHMAEEMLDTMETKAAVGLYLTRESDSDQPDTSP